MQWLVNIRYCRSNVLGTHSSIGKLQISCVDDRLLDVLNTLLRSEGLAEVHEVRVSTVQSLQLNGHHVQSRQSCALSRNSFTVEFDDLGQLSFGCVDLFIKHGSNYFALIQRLVIEDWPLCKAHDDDLSDIISVYGNLQSLVGEDIIPAQESDNYIAVDVGKIIGKVVCVKMDCSSCLFLVRIPNTIECD